MSSYNNLRRLLICIYFIINCNFLSKITYNKLNRIKENQKEIEKQIQIDGKTEIDLNIIIAIDMKRNKRTGQKRNDMRM